MKLRGVAVFILGFSLVFCVSALGAIKLKKVPRQLKQFKEVSLKDLAESPEKFLNRYVRVPFLYVGEENNIAWFMRKQMSEKTYFRFRTSLSRKDREKLIVVADRKTEKVITILEQIKNGDEIVLFGLMKYERPASANNNNSFHYLKVMLIMSEQEQMKKLKEKVEYKEISEDEFIKTRSDLDGERLALSLKFMKRFKGLRWAATNVLDLNDKNYLQVHTEELPGSICFLLKRTVANEKLLSQFERGDPVVLRGKIHIVEKQCFLMVEEIEKVQQEEGADAEQNNEGGKNGEENKREKKASLSEGEKKTIWQELILARHRATKEAMTKHPQDFMKSIEVEEQLEKKYEGDILKKHHLTQDQIKAIDREATVKGWLRPEFQE